MNSKTNFITTLGKLSCLCLYLHAQNSVIFVWTNDTGSIEYKLRMTSNYINQSNYTVTILFMNRVCPRLSKPTHANIQQSRGFLTKHPHSILMRTTLEKWQTKHYQMWFSFHLDKSFWLLYSKRIELRVSIYLCNVRVCVYSINMMIEKCMGLQVIP